MSSVTAAVTAGWDSYGRIVATLIRVTGDWNLAEGCADLTARAGSPAEAAALFREAAAAAPSEVERRAPLARAADLTR